jgi:hypothetical protein
MKALLTQLLHSRKKNNENRNWN